MLKETKRYFINAILFGALGGALVGVFFIRDNVNLIFIMPLIGTFMGLMRGLLYLQVAASAYGNILRACRVPDVFHGNGTIKYKGKTYDRKKLVICLFKLHVLSKKRKLEKLLASYESGNTPPKFREMHDVFIEALNFAINPAKAPAGVTLVLRNPLNPRD